MEKYGFVYIWYDRKHKRYYVGSHWGTENDGYVCSSRWMMKSYVYRSYDFKRRILFRTYNNDRKLLYNEEQRWLNFIKESEIKPTNLKPRYYNLHISVKSPWYQNENIRKSVGDKISASKIGKNTGPRDPSVGQKISEAKRKKRLEREAAGLPIYDMSDKVRAANAAKIGKTHSDEHKNKISAGMKTHFIENPSIKAEPISRMSRESQSKLCSEQLKARWSDPVWKSNQIQRLTEGAKNRPSRNRKYLNNNELAY